jgi:hypothetical protein
MTAERLFLLEDRREPEGQPSLHTHKLFVLLLAAICKPGIPLTTIRSDCLFLDNFNSSNTSMRWPSVVPFLQAS